MLRRSVAQSAGVSQESGISRSPPRVSIELTSSMSASAGGSIRRASLVERRPRFDGLVDRWLNLQKEGGVTFVYAPESLTISAPKIEGAAVSLHPRAVAIGPGTFVPFHSVNKEKSEVMMKWPPTGSLAPISPDAESASRFPATRITVDNPVGDVL